MADKVLKKTRCTEPMSILSAWTIAKTNLQDLILPRELPVRWL